MDKSTGLFSLHSFISAFIFSIFLFLVFSSAANAAGTFAVIANTPENRSVRVPFEVKPTATLNKDIFTASIYGFTLKNADTGRGVYTDYSYDAAKRTITLTPASPLEEFTNYTATVFGVTSLDGETIDPAYVWTFRTQDRTVPVASSSHESGLYITTLDVVLSCNDGSGSGCAAIHYTLDGSEPTVNSPVYSTPIFLDEGIYTLKYFAIDNEDNKSEIHTRQYTVDLTPPEVKTPVSPEINSTEVNVKSIVSFGFSEAVRSETVNTSTIMVDKGTVGDVVYDASTHTVTFTPKERLTCNTLYTVTINTGITDLAGNTMTDDYVWSFATTTDCIDPTANISTLGGVFRLSNQTVYLSCTDAQSGCRQIVYTADGTAPSFKPINGTIVNGTNTESILLIEGNTTLRYLAEDNGGNLSAEQEQVYSLSTQGFLYVGTNDGIARGVGPEADDFVFSWNHYRATDAFYDDTIGRLYLGAEEGLFYSDDLGRSWTYREFDYPTSTALRGPVSVIYAEGSKVYLGTPDGLQISHDGLASHESRGSEQGISRYLNDIVANGRYVYAATSAGVAISDTKGQTFVTRGLESGLNSDVVTSIAVDGQRIFVTTNAGLSISQDGGQTFENRGPADGLGDVGPGIDYQQWDVFVDGNNIYVGATNGLSISRDGGQTFITRTVEDGLAHPFVYSVFARGNTIYAGTSNGLSVSHDGGQSFTSRTTSDGLPGNSIRDILEADNNLIVVTYDGLAISTDGGNSFQGLGLPGQYPRKIVPQGNSIYVATTAGMLVSHDGGVSFELRNVHDGFADGSITDIQVTADNKVFASTTAGLSYSLDGGNTFNTYTTELKLPDDYLKGVYVDEQGTIFATHSWGLSVKKKKGGKWFRTKTVSDDLLTNSLWAVDGSNGVVYVGSYKGLSVSDNGGRSFVTRTTADGLGSDDIRQIYATDSVVYVVTSGNLGGGGIYVSYDDGKTFSLKNNTARSILSLSGYGNYVYTAGFDPNAGGYNLNISADGGGNFVIRDHTHGIGDYVTSIWSGNYTP